MRRICRTSSVPVGWRRTLGRRFVEFSGEEFSLQIDGYPYTGRLDNYIEWIVHVTGQYYEFPYLNLVQSLRLGGTALDIGANVGNHTAALSRMFERVLAIEPFVPVFERLQEKSSWLPNARMFNVGFGDSRSERPFSPPSDLNLGTGRIQDTGEITIPVVVGDDFLGELGVGDLRFVKIDVEGHEASVLAGLTATIKEHRPIVMFENPGQERVDHLGGIFRAFPDRYSFWGLGGHTTVPVQRAMVRPVALPTRMNWRRFRYVLACPNDMQLPLP